MQESAGSVCQKLHMPGPSSVELLSFRRTFTLLILLVVLPSAGLSGFGIVAIINEQAAVEKRLELVWVGRLERARADFAAALSDTQVTATQPTLILEHAGLRLTDVGFSVRRGEVHAEDSNLAAAVKSLGSELMLLPERPVIFSITSPQGTFLLAALRQGEQVLGAQLAASAVDHLLATIGKRLTPVGEEGHFVLVPVKRHETPEGLIARLVSEVSEVREAAWAPRELAGDLLPSPMQDFRLVVLAKGEDPVITASTRNRLVYSILLGIFYVALAMGVVKTGRTLYREARLSRLKTDFVSLVSHELRTPLTSIRMFIEMLALGRVKDPTEMQTVLDLLSKETSRLSGMIESVLDWSLIETGKKRYRIKKIPASELVDAAVSAFKAQRLETEAQLTVTVAAQLGNIEVDRDALSSALLNLLQNAYKYSHKNDRRIELRGFVDRDLAVLEVKDYGVGIPKSEHRRIFDRFYRVDTLLTRDTEGSGLGLSIAQRIVQAHDGWISVDSAPGTGSTFRIHLPRVP